MTTYERTDDSMCGMRGACLTRWSAVRSFARRRLSVRAIGRAIRRAMLVLALSAISAPAAFASTGGASMPWDTPLQNLLNNLTGPTARALIIIAIVGCGLLWAFTRNEEGVKRLGQIAFGGAIALGAVALLTSLGFAGAVV